jgi:mRNA interferase RelE/StbE
MRYEILLAPEAVEDLRSLKASVRTATRSVIEKHLRYEPTKTSRSRIKRLRGLSRPQYRLRVDEIRILYDVVGSTVEILAVIAKSEAESWLSEFGHPE